MAEFATQWQVRRGTTEEHSSFTGALAEVTFDVNKKTLVLHDGVTQGGFPLPTFNDLLNKIDKAEADSRYRTNDIKIQYEDLDEVIKNKLDESKYDDTNIQNSINYITANMVTLSQAQEMFKGKTEEDTSLVSYSRLDEDVTSLFSGLQATDTNLDARVSVIEGDYITSVQLNTLLQNYRAVGTQITLDDLETSLQTSINKIGRLQTTVEGYEDSINEINKIINESGLADLSEIEAKVNEIEGKINSGEFTYDDTAILEEIEGIKTRLNNITTGEGDITNYDDTELRNRIETLETTVSNLETSGGSSYDDTEIRSELNTLSDTVTTLETTVSGLSNYDDSEITANVNDLTDTVSALETTVNGLSNYDDTEIKNDISTLQTKVSNLESSGGSSGGGSSYDDTQVKSDISTLQSDVSNLKSNVSTLELKVSSLESTSGSGSGSSYDDTQVKSDISSLQSDVSSLQSTVSGLSNYDDSQVKSDISELQSTVEGLTNYDDTQVKSDISTLQSDVSSLQSTVSDLSNYDDTQVKSDISTLQSDVSELKSNATFTVEEKTTITNKLTSVSNIRSEVDSTSDKVTELEGKVTTNTGDISDLDTRVTALENSITNYDLTIANMAKAIEELQKQIKELSGNTVETWTDMNGNEREVVWSATVDNFTGMHNILLSDYEYPDTDAATIEADFYENDILEAWNLGPTGNLYETPVFIPNDDVETEGGLKDQDPVFKKFAYLRDSNELRSDETGVATTEYTIKLVKLKPLS